MKKATLVFWYSLIVCTFVVLWGAIWPEHLQSVTSTATAFVSSRLGWYYLLIIVGILVFCVCLVFSRFKD
ncbi:BCCT family transporter, partial [Micrococcus sp. SIMBA_144]